MSTAEEWRARFRPRDRFGLSSSLPSGLSPARAFTSMEAKSSSRYLMVTWACGTRRLARFAMIWRTVSA